MSCALEGEQGSRIPDVLPVIVRRLNGCCLKIPMPAALIHTPCCGTSLVAIKSEQDVSEPVVEEVIQAVQIAREFELQQCFQV